ncbi:hypothetical protein J7J47_16375 [Halomonas sp. ISL-60]|uniref:hypothetical protein n=1 Tax=Halomonas sp. ISL-56 TaxID=2819149 RepID=UPI001BE764F6|nr:hypothetical protein [Halomonas sp. ISL-56]MBT2773800.1 hypothetical protein [Halomonas sp. ISL-60]MBT2800016.1 hypothetical protein [Halomonas sp. ISL-56]
MIPIHHGTPQAVDARVREDFVEHLCLVNEDFFHEKRALLEENDALAVENVALRKEAEQYRAAEEAQIALRQKMEQERDALSAHVASGKATVANMLEVHMENLSEWESEKVKEAAEWVAEPPAKSLARRDLAKQAEALETLYNDSLGHGGDGMVRCGIMLDRAIELREEATEVCDENSHTEN